MEHEIWIQLRRLQTHPAHQTWRPLIMSLLEEAPVGADWPLLLAAARERDCPLEFLAQSAPEAEDIAKQEALRLHRQGIHLMTPADPRYPEVFRCSIDPPLSFTALGELSCLSRPALAVVGSREPQMASLHWMESELALFCRQTQAVIVSGGARGVDQKAHSVALRNEAPTVVMLPSGIECPYPADIGRWFRPVLDSGGLVLSEYPSRLLVRKPHFHQRNRLIAAAGLLTLVVEARTRSGTLITAMRAAEIGKPLVVVPGHPRDLNFGGSLQLLAEGATMVRHNEDLILFWEAEQKGHNPHNQSLESSDRVAP